MTCPEIRPHCAIEVCDSGLMDCEGCRDCSDGHRCHSNGRINWCCEEWGTPEKPWPARCPSKETWHRHMQRVSAQLYDGCPMTDEEFDTLEDLCPEPRCTVPFKCETRHPATP